MRRVWETQRGVALRDDIDDVGDYIRIRHFWVPVGGGYVWEEFPNHHGTTGRQVCDGLSHYGSTLRSTRGGLAALIRREYRRAKRQA